MRRFLWICLAVLLFACGNHENSNYRSPRADQSVGFKLPDKPTIEGIYKTSAREYIGTFYHKSNCGQNHGGKGSHDLTGVIEFKDNGQFVMKFSTYQGDSLVYQSAREGYWALTDRTYITMAVAHELNSNMEITVVNPKASLKIFFRILDGKAQYMNEYQKTLNFRMNLPGGNKLEKR